MINRTVRFVGVVSLASAILSCGGGGGNDGPTGPPPPTVDLNAVSNVTVTAPTLTVAVGKSVLLSAQATNVNGTVLANQQFVWSTSSASTATIEQNGTLRGVAPGQVNVAAAIGAKNGQVMMTVVPAPAAATIAINSGNDQAATVNTAVATPPSVIVKDAAGDPVSGVTVMFAVAPNSGSVTGATQVTNAAGIATVGSWTLGSSAGPQTLTATSGTLTGSPVTFTATAVALPANMRQYNVSTTNGCQSIQLRTGEVKAETAHLTIVADVSNPSGGFTAADYAEFAATFESLVWPVVTENFGAPTDIDASGRVVAFFTSAVNSLTPAGSTSFVGGFFFGRDLLPRVADNVHTNFNCPGSNQTEMFYILAPDPTGSLGLAHSTAFVRNMAVGVIGHEMQHLINFSRRLYINTNATDFEELFMEEGLSHIAEELIFYEASGFTPKSNLTSAKIQETPAKAAAASAYIRSNLQRFSLYLKSPSNNSPYANNDALPTRGATWSWLRYLADRGSASAVAGPECSATITLAANASCRLDAGGTFSIDGGTGSEYTIVTFADGVGFSTSASATNAVAVSGPPSPSRYPGGPALSQISGPLGQPTLEMGFHIRLREAAERDVRPRMRRARARFAQHSRGSARFSIARAPVRTSFAAVTVDPVWGRLVNSGFSGIENLKVEFGTNIQGAARDWAVANYVDDAVAVAQTQYTHPSWNFRSAMSIPNVAPYALQTQSLSSSTSNVTMVDGGAGYYRLGVAAGTTSTVTFIVTGAAATNLKLVVVRTK